LTGGTRTPRSVVRVLLPSGLTSVGLVVLYFCAPLDRPWTPATVLILAAGLVLAAVTVGWQTWAIARSPYPRLRAVAVLVSSFPTLILLFSVAYVLLAHDRSGAFSEPLNRVGSVYFAMTVFTTVGFGDIVARSQVARIIVIAQMLVDLTYVGLLARSIIEATRIGMQRRTERRAG
jgi:voltage-gated potassium channel